MTIRQDETCPVEEGVHGGVYHVGHGGEGGERGSRLLHLTSMASEVAIDRSQRWCSQRLPESIRSFFGL